MSIESQRADHDPRSHVARCGFFTQRPDLVEEYLWDLGLPTAAERVFWFHWREGMRSGDWCSSVPIKVVAARCRLDVSTVTRAYQMLKGHGLIQRESSGRDPANPFQQATAVTEVRLPRELVTRLSRMPRRFAGLPVEKPKPAVATPSPAAVAARAPNQLLVRALVRKLGGEDSRRFLAALNARQPAMQFSPGCTLTDEERRVLNESIAHAASQPAEPAKPPAPAPLPPASLAQSRRLNLLELARLQTRVREVVANADAPEAIRQVAWSVQYGALRRYPTAMAVNIAAKKLREGCWSRPNRMPPNWALLTAVPGLCGAA
jgi:hypothetical protein